MPITLAGLGIIFVPIINSSFELPVVNCFIPSCKLLIIVSSYISVFVKCIITDSCDMIKVLQWRYCVLKLTTGAYMNV